MSAPQGLLDHAMRWLGLSPDEMAPQQSEFYADTYGDEEVGALYQEAFQELQAQNRALLEAEVRRIKRR